MNIDQIVDRLRELKWHIDDDGEKQLREVINEAGTNANEVKTYEQMEKVKRMLDVAYWAALKARNALKTALEEAQTALDDVERQQEDASRKMKAME
jgi:hypothetical protein